MMNVYLAFISFFMLNNLMSQAPKTRIRIFDYWQMQQPTIQSQPQRRRTAESALASDVLTQALMLRSNIWQFLEQKEQYTKQIQICKQNIRAISSGIHSLCNSLSEEANTCESEEKKFKQSLGKLYSELRGSKIIHFCISQYFQKANLVNYDPNLMQLNFSQTSQSMKAKLLDSIKSIETKMYRLTEAEEAGQFLVEYSAVFGKQYSSKFCLNALQQQLRHQNLIKIHFLMLYQLQEFSKSVDEFFQFLTISQSEYLKFQLVLDCITLMKQQAKQMGNLTLSAQKDLEQICKRPQQIDNHLLAEQQQKRIKSWRQNLVIYETNLDNFTRANVQTNMVNYTVLKGKFIQQLQKFAEEIGLSEERSKCLIYLVDRYSLYQDLRKRVQLGHNIDESDRKLLLNIYNQSGTYEVPSHSVSLHELKDYVLKKLEDFLYKNNIAYNKRARRTKPDQFSIKRQLKLLKDLQQALPRVSTANMTKNYKNIKSSLFQLESLLHDIDNQKNDKDGSIKKDDKKDLQQMEAAKSTKIALMYAQVIANNTPFQNKLLEFNKIKGEGFKGLIKFQLPLFNYVSDIHFILQHRKMQESSQQLYAFKKNLTEAIGKSLQKSNIDVIVEKQAEILKEMWFKIYNSHLKRVSNYGQDLIYDEITQITMKITEAVIAATNKVPKLVQPKKMDIETKLFFTHRILNELLQLVNSSKGDTSQFRIKKLDKILEQIFRDLDNNFLSKKLGGKISDIVKLSLLQKYLSKVYGNNNLQIAIITLRKIAYYQSLADIYPTSTDNQNILLEGLLQIQFKMGEINTSFKENDEFQKLLDDNIMRLVKEMRRYPLTLAVKHDISGFMAVFRYQSIINELKQIQKPTRKKLVEQLSITNIARFYLCIQDLKSCRKCYQTHYDSYQNIIVKQRRSVQYYFSKAKDELAPRIQPIRQNIQNCSGQFLNWKQVISLSKEVQSLCKNAI